MTPDLAIFKWLLVVLGLLIGVNTRAQSTGQNDSLFREIVRMDSLVFAAFNNRDVETFGASFSKDLEFYHDKGGLTGYTHTVEFMKTTAAKKDGLRRTLVPGSSEVYPIPAYGAMQIGSHTFCHTEAGTLNCGTFKFVHIWKKTETGWQITRVVSYGH